MKRTNRKIIGYILIMVGIALPLIGFTGMTYNNLMAKRAYEAFKSHLQGPSNKRDQQLMAYNEKVKKQESPAIVDPFTAGGYRSKYDIDQVADGGIFAFLIIPKLDLVKPIYLGASNENLAKGLGHIDGTSLPIGGEGTRAVIAGHRGWYRDTMFLAIDDLVAGDRIYVDGGRGLLVYEVVDKEVIGGSDWEKLAPSEGEDILTLLTCHPFAPPRPYRLLINSLRVEEEPVNPPLESGAKSSIKPKPVKVDPKTKYMNYGIYAITGLGYLAIVMVFLKFVGFLRACSRSKRSS